ncbi:MAG TPA: hypothetical protein VIU61_28830 [Kofleriaceae bacterium]
MIRILLAIAIVAAPLRVLADPAGADRAAAEAETLAQEGKFAEAAAKFREAYKQDQRPDLFCNIGITTYKAQQLAPAHLLLAQCLDRASLDPQFVETARAVLASIETALRAGDFCPVNFQLDPLASSVTIDGFGDEAAFVGSRVVWLPFGTHRVTVRAGGHDDSIVEVVTTSREPKTETIKLARQFVKPIAMTPGATIEKRSKIPAIASSAVTGIALIGLAVSFSKARSSADRAVTAFDELSFKTDRDNVEKWNTRLAISSVIAILGAGASGFFWYRALAPGRVEIRGDVRGEGGATVSVGGRF